MKFFVKLDPNNPKRQPFPYFEPPPGAAVVKPENPDEPKDGGVPGKDEEQLKKSRKRSKR